MARDYENISRPTGVCSLCRRCFEPGNEYVATVREQDEQFERRDYCPSCYDGADEDESVVAVWRARAPEPKQKRKLFVDDDVLMNFFRRLDGDESDSRVNFRFVLALVLMRKKLLVYEGSEKLDDGREVWTMRYKGADETCRVLDPHMDEEKIAEVSEQLNQILETDL
ncbi:MAG: hypothetical protein ACP5HU_00655 [Phycisphaerae bacterium]